MATHSNDGHFVRRALELARQGIGLVSPSPCVGALLVDANGATVGEGVYTYSGQNHAEVLALAQAGENSRGATLYINLEPHAHQGRTPPCTDALIAAGIVRVVASMADPNPKVSGRGFRQLRAAGVEVEIGMLEEEARRLNESFARYIRHGVPLVTLKSAMTLDGKIAPPPSIAIKGGAGIPPGGWITGEAARAHVHELRHGSDAIFAGIGTILADDPLLTDRSGRPRRRPLLRVIADSHLRLPLSSRIVQSANKNGDNDVLVFCLSSDQQRKRDLESQGIRAETIPPSSDGHLALPAMIRRLGELEIASLMIEGGSAINAAALAAGIVDKVFLYYAPKIFADDTAIAFASGPHRAPISSLQSIRVHRFAQDFAVEGYLRDPYSGVV